MHILESHFCEILKPGISTCLSDGGFGILDLRVNSEFAFQTRVPGELGWLGWNLASVLIHGPIRFVDHDEEVCK